MRKVTNYLMMFMMAATVLFVTSCGEDTETPTPGSSINLSSDAGTIVDGRLLAAPGAQVEITASLGASSTEDISVVTNNSTVASVPATNTFTSGGSIIVTIGGSLGDEATLTFSGNGVNETLIIEVGYNTVVDAALSTSNLSTLVAALQEADLVTTLQGDGPFTVFAPTNDAFAALAAQLGISASELLDRDDLANILLYHVVGGDAAAKAGDLTDGQILTTLHPDGLGAVVAISGTTVTINNATVTTPDIETGNGIVHIIDRVLLPQTIAEYEAVLLAAPLGTRASKTFFSAADGMTYSVEEVIAGTNVTSAEIDFGYYYGQNNNASIASPADYPEAVYDLTSSGANWSALNATMFRPVNNFTLDDFNALTEADAAKLVQEYEISSGEVGELTNLSAGDLFAFKTVDNRYGIFFVSEITGEAGSDGQIELDVKVTN